MELGKRRVKDGTDAPMLLVADALAIDNGWESYVHSGGHGLESCILDLSSLDYLDHDSLLFLGALVSQRVHIGAHTLIELPRAERVWHYLRSWKFPTFIEQITNQSFVDILAPDSQAKYLASSSEAPAYVRVIDLPGGGTEELLPLTHFQLTAVRMFSNRFKAASLAKDAWMERHLLTVLDAYLAGEGERIGSLVVLEAVLNAAMHPKATMAFTSSQIVRSRFKSDPTATKLEIGIWDNGLAMADTLKNRLDAGLSITSQSFGAIDEQLTVRLVQDRAGETVRVIRPTVEDLHPDFAWLTAAAFLAGVTSLPERSSDDTGDGIRSFLSRDASIAGDSRGMGLYYIRRNVINLWGGRIRYWSGNYRLTMSTGGESGTYNVSIQHRPNSSWPLRGNTLIMEIPLDRGRVWNGA